MPRPAEPVAAVQETAPRPPGEAEPASDMKGFLDLLRGAMDFHALPQVGLLVLALLYTLYFARPFLLPLVLAILLTLLLRPLIAAMARARIPEPVGAGLVVLGLVAAVIGAGYGLSGPAVEWLHDAPGVMHRIEAKVTPLLRPVKRVNEATEAMQEQLQDAGMSDGGGDTQKVQLKQPGMGGTLMQQASGFIGTATVVVILLYFLLASGDLFLRKLVKVLPNFREKKRALEIAYEIRQGVSTYLLTVSVIYLFLGVATAVAMWLLGMPNPILWGAMAGLLNFIPYLGAVITALVLSAVAVLSFDSMGHALLVPLTFMTLTTIEGYFVTPTVLGRRLTLNPVMIFLGMTFWWWLWGIPGALLAVPMLAVLKIVCDHIERLQPIGEFLGH